MTGEEVCTYIADWLEEKTGNRPSNDAIWNMGYRGELYPVYDLYCEARMDRENLRMVIDLRPGPHTGDIEWLPWSEGEERVTYLTK